MPHDSPLPGGHTPGSDEGRMQQNELMDLVTKLSNRVLVLETDLKETKKVYSTSKTCLYKAHHEDIQGRYEDISTAEFNISTTKPVFTAGEAVTTASVSTAEPSKGKMVESEKPSKKKDQVKADEELAKRLKEEMQAKLEEEARIERIAQEEAFIAVHSQSAENQEFGEDSKVYMKGKQKLINDICSSTDFEVVDLHRLVQERYDTTSPEGYDLLLWGDLKILFEPNEEDEIWKNQQDYNLISWRLFDSCGVHVLLMNTGIVIHMMIEKKYPLTQEMLSRMLSRRLEVDHESEMAFELLNFTRSQLKE
ncbi:hypothetical protein Tco_0437796 [Tanacetum coccineum]